MCEPSACMCVYHIKSWLLKRSEEGTLELELQMTVNHLMGAWESHLGLPQEQHVLLTAEPSLWHHKQKFGSSVDTPCQSES